MRRIVLDSRSVRAWLPVAVWAAFVWSLGGDGFSMARTSGLLEPLLRWLAPALEPAALHSAQLGVRKLAHMAEYGVLAALSLRAALRSMTPRRAAACALGLAAGLAVADELRQSASGLRTGAAADVGLDLLGAALALGGSLALRRALPGRTRTPGAAT